MNSQAKYSLLRQLLTLAGGLLAGIFGVSMTQEATAINDIMTIVPAAVSLGSLVWSVYAHWRMVKVHEATPVLPPGKGAPVTAGAALARGIVGMFALFVALAALSDAHAAARRVTLPHATENAASGKLTTAQVAANPLALLRKFAANDLSKALADANANKDTAAAACYTALLGVIQSGVANPLPAGPGVFQALQKARDAKALLANLQSPTGPLAGLNVACAPLVLDAQNTLLGLGVGVGLVANPAGATAALAGLPAALAAFLALPKL